MSEHPNLNRRQALECMVWAGTGVVWTVAGGVPSSRLIGAARADETRLLLRADFRQPYRLRKAGQSRRARRP